MDKRTVRAWELNDLYVRMVRHMLTTNDTASLLETGSGTPEEAEVLVRCYELAAMELWDDEAIFEAAMVAGDGIFTRSNGDPERIRRNISLAIKSGRTPAFVSPPEGIKLLYRLGVAVFDELELTVMKFSDAGRYDDEHYKEAEEPLSNAPAESDAETVPWRLAKRERMDALTNMIYRVLEAALTAGEDEPKARDVMGALEDTRPPGYVGLAEGEIKYEDDLGEIQTVNLKALQKRIDRLIERPEGH